MVTGRVRQRLLRVAPLSAPIWLVAAMAFAQAPASAPPADGCVACHQMLDGATAAPTKTLGDDIHRQKGFTCASGMEVGDHQLALRQARSQLTLSRAEVHGLDRGAVEKIAAEGTAVTAAVERAGADAVAELKYFRQGLAASMVAILLVIVALVAKIRPIDGRTPAEPRDS